MLGRGRHRTTRGAFGAVVAALLVAACGGSDGIDTTPEPQRDTAIEAQGQASTTTLPERATSTTTNGPPTLLANTVDGDQVDVSALVGQDALLWFWAPW